MLSLSHLRLHARCEASDAAPDVGGKCQSCDDLTPSSGVTCQTWPRVSQAQNNIWNVETGEGEG